MVYVILNLLEFDETLSNFIVGGGSLLELSCGIGPPGEFPTNGEPSIFEIGIPNCGSQWFLNTFSASSNRSSIRVPCKKKYHIISNNNIPFLFRE